jgi:spermidine/putrescine ABC transporter ATP-binding subunit
VELRLAALGKRYLTTVAVDRLDLTVGAGEFMTLLGPSGSGKTTTLMMVAGFVAPTSGDVRLGGQSLVAVPPHRRNLGVVFQHYALFPHMTVTRNLAFPLRMRGVARGEIERRVRETLALVKLDGLEARYPRQLSGGQQQRVALARALVYRPPLLLLDEPLGALDRQLRGELQLEIKRIQRTLGLTVVHITHDQEEALVLSDRICVMNAGRAEQVGTPQDLYEAPASRFVAGFLGESNFLTGEVVSADGVVATLAVAPGITLAVEAPPGLAPRARVDVVIRPERLRFSAGTDENVLHGTLEETIYVGDARRHVVRLAHGLRLIVKRSADEPAAPHLTVGASVRLGCRRQDIRILRRS